MFAISLTGNDIYSTCGLHASTYAFIILVILSLSTSMGWIYVFKHISLTTLLAH